MPTARTNHDAIVVEITKYVHPTDQGQPTYELEEHIYKTLEKYGGEYMFSPRQFKWMIENHVDNISNQPEKPSDLKAYQQGFKDCFEQVIKNIENLPKY
jgi:hypothetical protein